MRAAGPVDDTHAIVALEHALAVNPNDVEALSRLGPLYKKREDYSKARARPPVNILRISQ